MTSRNVPYEPLSLSEEGYARNARSSSSNSSRRVVTATTRHRLFRPFSLLLALLAVGSTVALLRLFGNVKTSDRIASLVDVVIQSPDGSLKASFIPLGAAMTELWFAERDLILGFDDRSQYRLNPAYLGAVVGRYANRIRTGSFEVGGRTVTVDKNENGNTLHGGLKGYSHRPWTIVSHTDSMAAFALTESDTGFPGTVDTIVKYELLDEAVFRIEMRAKATQDTPIMLSSHVYWTLGEGMTMQMNSQRRIAVDAALIPTGEIVAMPEEDVKNYKREKAIQGGVDDCYLYDDLDHSPQLVLSSPSIKMSISTNQPAVQIYTCSGLPDIPRKKHQGTGSYDKSQCVVIEQQGWIDGINHPEWHQDQIYGHDREYVWIAEHKLEAR